MPTELLPTRSEASTKESLSPSFWLALALHSLAFGGFLVAALLGHSHSQWGGGDPMAGSIQANVVSSLPLPPKQRFAENQVLASDHSSAAPTPAPPTPKPASPVKPSAAPPPKPNEVLIPTKTTPKPTANAEHTQPTPTTRAPIPTPPTTKAAVGDTAGIQIPQSITQLKNGTALLTVEDRTFGDRYAYYIRLIVQKITQSKSEGDPDGPETRGRKATIRFVINRDGVPTDVSISAPSGSAALDTSTLRAIQRIDTFGPLPAGDHKVILFEYDSK